jgi:putative spermidine/putrescine transport system ATP-binding protein
MKDFEKLIMKDVGMSYGDLHVLRDFNLTVDRNEFVTLLGPSGCGKSTALSCISGLLHINDGRIQVDDEILDDGRHRFVSPEKRGFGIIFQNYALFPHMTVFNNIAFSLSVSHKPKDEIKKRVEEAIRMVHLEGQELKFPSQLSGGQQQRVAIARSVVIEPRLLLLDEPLSNLDTKLRIEMRYELKQIHHRLERASIYVTHDQSEALALSDKIVVMKIGKIQQIGTPKAVYLHPDNRFVADFMGYKNIWKAKICEITESEGQRQILLESNGFKFISQSSIAENIQVDTAVINAAKLGEEVLVAIRPDDISFGAAAVNTLEATVEVTEYLGTTNQVSAKFKSGTLMQARVTPSHSISMNDRVSFNIDPHKIFVIPDDKEEA